MGIGLVSNDDQLRVLIKDTAGSIIPASTVVRDAGVIHTLPMFYRLLVGLR